MRFITATNTDIGTRKKTNQDSMLVMQAETTVGTVLFASMCDGMGGLAKGEVASAAMVRALEAWFRGQLPDLIQGGFTGDKLYGQWREVIDNTNRTIADYGIDNHVSLGTTCASLLIINDHYYIVNVGDSRVYKISDRLIQLTKDQTYVQREIDAGRMTERQALTDPNRSVLLQCIGASDVVSPVFSDGPAYAGEVYMLCCDGFRHVISQNEFFQAFRPDLMTSREVMTAKIGEIIRLNIARREDDNISAILIKTL